MKAAYFLPISSSFPVKEMVWCSTTRRVKSNAALTASFCESFMGSTPKMVNAKPDSLHRHSRQCRPPYCTSARMRYNGSTSQKTKLGFDDSSQAQFSRATTGSGFFIASTRNRFGGACGTPQGVQFLRLFVNPHVLPPLFDDLRAGLKTCFSGVNMTNALSIGTSAVRTLDNLYSLNDLHKAAGSEAKHKPANFLRLNATVALIAEIERFSEMSTAKKVVNGNAGGTFVCKELVYAYAMWVDAAFALKVIRTFDSLQFAPTTLTPAQQQQLKAAVQTVCKGDGKAYSELYRLLYSRFGVPKYQDIQQADFLDAMGFIGNHQSILEQHEKLGLSEYSLNNRRLLVSFNNGKEQIQSVPNSACVAAPEEWASMIRDAGGLWLEPQTLADIATACTERLARQSASYMQSTKELRLKLQNQERISA